MRLDTLFAGLAILAAPGGLCSAMGCGSGESTGGSGASNDAASESGGDDASTDSWTGVDTSTGTGSTDGKTDARADVVSDVADAAGETTSEASAEAGDASVAKLVFDEEFDTLSLYDSATKKGTWAPTGLDHPTNQGMHGWGAEYDLNPITTTTGVNPFGIHNGVLTIATDNAASSLQSLIDGYKYTSGALRTMNVTLGYGYYEMGAQLPTGNGNWPAFWLLPSDGAWPPEIDIVEGLANSPTQIYCSVHSTVAFPGNTSNPGSNHWAVTFTVNTANTQTGFHTYGLDFAGSTVTWYFDGMRAASVATPSDLVNRSVYIVIDNALGGWNNNAIDSTTKFPSSYQIDYIRVYDAKP